MDCSQGSYQPNSDGIPIDLFVSKSKKKPHNTNITSNGFNLKFTDSNAKLVFSVHRHRRSDFDHHRLRSPPDPAPSFKRLLSDASGNSLISITHNKVKGRTYWTIAGIFLQSYPISGQETKATWHGFRKDSNEEKDQIFRVERTINTLTKVEFEVFLNNGNPNNFKTSNFKMKGSPFYRSCTIYDGDSIVAQTSLMYKLGIQKVLVPRNRFRLTIFPGYTDHAFIVALTVIFFYGRKLWI